MRRSRTELLRPTQNAFRGRLRVALCLPVRQRFILAAGTGTTGPQKTSDPQRGSAVVEFTFLAVLLMVPVVYFVVTIGQLQGGSFAVVGAADQAAKVFVAQSSAVEGRIAAERTVLVALGDYGHTAEQATVDITCDREDCLSSGAAVTVTVRLRVPLPMMPFGDSLPLNAGRLTASATQVVGRFT